MEKYAGSEAVSGRFSKMSDWAEKNVKENILPFWIDRVRDYERGGFHGTVMCDGTPVKDSSRLLVLNARILWSFSNAYRVFGTAVYKEMADEAYRYLTTYFEDKENGGYYFSVDCDGKPLETQKVVYTEAFVIYAFSEYHRATGHEEAAKKAWEIFELLEKYSIDTKYRGYIEQLSADWKYDASNVETALNPEDSGGTKTMNTHLHLLEAYTCLLRINKDKKLVESMREMIDIMLSRIINTDINHFGMYFTDEWKSTVPTISYGHDIEGTWLIMEACEVLGEEEVTQRAKKICMDMARACLLEGLDEEGSMYSEGEPGETDISSNRTWWVQSEAVIGFLNAWQMTGEMDLLEASEATLTYIDRYFVDNEYGEWHTSVDRKESVDYTKEKKIQGWKAPYHNSRMCIEIIERYRH